MSRNTERSKNKIRPFRESHTLFILRFTKLNAPSHFLLALMLSDPLLDVSCEMQESPQARNKEDGYEVFQKEKALT